MTTIYKKKIFETDVLMHELSIEASFDISMMVEPLSANNTGTTLTIKFMLFMSDNYHPATLIKLRAIAILSAHQSSVV